MVQKLTEWVLNNSPEFLEIGLTIAASIIRGMSIGLANVGIDIGNWITGSLGIDSKADYLTPEPVTDFILQPGGRLIRTDPNDTIMGSKSGFGEVE